MKTLLPYQEEGASFLARERKAFLGDEAGLGKTLQAIRACDHIGAERVLVICPPSVVVNWRREFAESSLLDPELDVFTPQKVTQGRVFVKDRYDAIILDEAHYYKSVRSARTTAIYGAKCEGEGIVAKAPHVFALSGSPAPNDPSELWSHLRALRPELIPGPTGVLGYHRFQQVFCQVRQTPFGPKIEGVRASKVPVLKGILSKFMLRRLENEVKLPELRVSPLYVEASIKRAEKSEDAELVRAAIEANGVAGLKALTASVATLRRMLGLAKIDPVIEYVEEWLQANDGKICIYAWHREVIDVYKTAFAGRSVSITGGTTDRQGQVDRFQTDPIARVFIGQIQAAGEAITLTKASEVLLVEPSWVPKDNYQVIKRIHRIGQTQPCSARFVTIAGSIDDQINKVLARKEAMLAEVLEGV